MNWYKTAQNTLYAIVIGTSLSNQAYAESVFAAPQQQKKPAQSGGSGTLANAEKQAGHVQGIIEKTAGGLVRGGINVITEIREAIQETPAYKDGKKYMEQYTTPEGRQAKKLEKIIQNNRRILPEEDYIRYDRELTLYEMGAIAQAPAKPAGYDAFFHYKAGLPGEAKKVEVKRPQQVAQASAPARKSAGKSKAEKAAERKAALEALRN